MFQQILQLCDGGEVALDWLCPKKNFDSTPVCLFLPGITGSSQADYIKSLVNVAYKKLGIKSVVFNFRGRGGHPLKSPVTYCASNTDDLVSVIDHIKFTHPRVRSFSPKQR